MASLTTIREAMQARLQTISGLRVHAIVPDSIETPAAIVVPAPGTFINFDTSFGTDDVFLTIQLIVSRSSDRAGQELLDSFLAGSGNTSIRTAVNGSLGGSAHFATVTDARNYGPVKFNEIEYYGCEIFVTVGVV